MTPLKRLLQGFLLLTLSFSILQCSTDDDKFDPVPENLVPTGRAKTYKMFSVDDSNIAGTATFAEKDQGYTTITLNLTNTNSGGEHPVFLHRFTGAEGGGKARDLGFVDGDTGTSATTISKLDNGDPISFDELLQFNGYINVVLSSSNPGTDICQGDIGQNELNGNVVEHDLANEEEGVIGTVSFNERVNGTTLVVVGLENNPEAGDYPAHIKENTGTPNEATVITLDPVDGNDGFGQSQVEEFDDGTPVSYTELIAFKGTLEVLESSGTNRKVIASSIIGPE